MKIIFFVSISILLFFSNPSVAQDWQETENTLEAQFNEVVEKSNSYQEYKVISKVKIANLQKNIFDSIAVLKKEIAATETEFDSHQKKIDSLSKNLATTKSELSLSKEKEDGITVFGMLTSKATYNTLMWSLILVLLGIGGFLLYKFLNSHKVTKATELKMAEMEMELEESRQNRIESEQVLRRKLQDEINKNRNK